jgi:hypothetical protein
LFALNYTLPSSTSIAIGGNCTPHSIELVSSTGATWPSSLNIGWSGSGTVINASNVTNAFPYISTISSSIAATGTYDGIIGAQNPAINFFYPIGPAEFIGLSTAGATMAPPYIYNSQFYHPTSYAVASTVNYTVSIPTTAGNTASIILNKNCAWASGSNLWGSAGANFVTKPNSNTGKNSGGTSTVFTLAYMSLTFADTLINNI